MFTKTSLDYWNLRYLLYSFRKGQKYISQNICNSTADSNFLFPGTLLVLEKICVYKSRSLKQIWSKIVQSVWSENHSISLPASVNKFRKSCILKQKKTAGFFECVWPFVIILHERVKVISQQPNVWKLKMMYFFEGRFDSVSWKKNKKRKLSRGKF